MGQKQQRLADSTMSNVVESLPSRMQPLFVEILSIRNPDLLAALIDHEEPSRDEREKVEDILATEFSSSLRPDWEPDPRGKRIDELLGAFLMRWPL
jgi:hypothetical protein